MGVSLRRLGLMPAHFLLLEILAAWRQQQPYRKPDD
jgi:hypothetical protein